MRTPREHVATDGTVTWTVRFREGVSAKTGRPKQTSETFDTRGEAERFAGLIQHMPAAEAFRQMDLELMRGKGDTLDEWAARYIDSLTGITEGTRITYRRIYANKWSPALGQLPLTAVTREAIRMHINALSTRYSDKTVANAHGLLAGMMNGAVLDGHLPASPCKGIRLPRRTEHETKELQFITHAEFSRLIAEIPEHYRPLFTTLIGTGIRWGEAAALTVADVDLEHATLRINKATKADPSKANKDIGPPKTKRSRRVVTLPAEVIHALAPLVTDRARREPLFTATKGGPLRHRNVYTDWKAATHRAGLEGLTIHSLRHSHAAWLIAMNVPLPVIQARLGHESITTTINVYGHLLPDLQRAAADAASVAFRPPAAIEK